jgi:hypothetical protein
LKIQTIRERLLAGTMMGGMALAAVVALPVAATVLAPTSAAAQDISSGTLTGAVKDAAGQPVTGASVEVRSTEQGFVRTTTTDASGSFRAALVPIGSYVVTIRAPGFDPIAQSARVALGGTSSYDFTLEPSSGAAQLGEIVVTGARQSLDFNKTTTGLSVDLEELVKELPVARSITAVTLLAPGTAEGDNAFGSLPSISGASVAENAYYINGLNITNFANFLGASVVPFDFYRSVEVKTGGYSAEFGRATGGVVNAVTKSGTNDFTVGLHANWAPDSLREQSPDTYAARNALDKADATSYVIELGGPIIRDRLFFYGITELRDVEYSDSSITGLSTSVQSSDDPFYGVKLDGYITQNHRLEFTYLDTTRETTVDTYAFNPSTDTTGAYQASTLNQNGGESWVGRYTGTLTNWLTVSAAYGKNKDSDSVVQTSDAVYAVDEISGTPTRVSPNQAGTINSIVETEREFFRADADLYFNLFGEHHVRVGYDKEKNSLLSVSQRPGPFQGSYGYHQASADDPLVDGGNLAVGEHYIETNIYISGGSFSGENEAYYIQDEWDVNDRLTLNLGVRLDKFLLNNLVGQELTNFDSEIGPRLGFAYDPTGDGRSRLYGFWGRYYMPIAANTASRMGGQELYYSEYFRTPAGYNPANYPGTKPYDADGAPVGRGAQIVGWADATACPAGPGFGTAGAIGCRVTSTGELYDASTQIGQNLESTMEEEIILGYERQFGDLWSAGVSFTFRDLKRSAEDIAIDAAVLKYCGAQGLRTTKRTAAEVANGVAPTCGDIWSGFHQYVIHNPGNSLQVLLSDPLPGETERRTVTLSASDLGYPPIKRQYQALQFTFERENDGVWGLQGSYTLSKSSGNFEGYVKSDNGQDDAGATTDFDQPGLMDGADGLLPNHHAHTFKVFGSYSLTKNLTLGMNAVLQSPRAYGCIGRHPTDAFAGAYGVASWYCQKQLTPRGQSFSGEWYRNVDFSARYSLDDILPFGNLVLRADVFNVFNFEEPTDYRERGDLSSGLPDPNYRKPISYQSPRYVRIGFDWTF